MPEHWPISIFIVLLGVNIAQAVFYRNIPFRYKSADGISVEEVRMERADGDESIAELLAHIEEDALRLAEQKLQRKEAEELQHAPRRTVRLIPLRSNNDESLSLFSGGGRQRQQSTSDRRKADTPLHSHLMALRPDYAFRNVANFLRNFFDSRIERHSRREAAKKAARND